MKNWPIYFKERLWSGNVKTGYVGMATLWTPKEKLVDLMPENVAVVGQLYTQSGIEFIVRNLWANPKISTLVICGRDSTGSGQALIKGNLPEIEEIPKKYLDIFLRLVKIVDLRKEMEPKKIAAKIAKIKPCPPFAPKSKLFPQTKISANFPSEASVFRIEAPTIGLAWLQILKTVIKFGRVVPRISVYGGEERMVMNLCAVVTEENISSPKIYPFFGFGKKQIKAYFREFFKHSRGEQAYTYGERIFDYLGVDQLAQMARKLTSFAYNKGALSVLWQPAVDNFPVRKPWRTPCLTLIQGICQDDLLQVTAYFRSNDMFGAWPYNAFALRKLQAVLAQKIGKKIGVLTIISHAAFIDEHDLAAAQKIVRQNDRLTCLWDPRGNLAVSVVGHKIIVRHFSPDGKFLQGFKVDGKLPKAADKMAEMLLQNQVISQVGHALDIGGCLARAEEAIKLGLKFEQDKNLFVG
jgi:thymidylate synthase